jgi:sensor histidine kinase YesM
MYISKKKLTAVFVFLILLLLTGCNSISNTPTPKAENGIVDLKKFNFDGRANTDLDGQWNFYWNKLIEYKDLKTTQPDFLVSVPNTWSDEHDLSGEGVATYTLKVATDLPKGYPAALNIGTVSSSYKLFVNEKLVAAAGKIGQNGESEVGEYRPQTVVFNVPESEFFIIIQVSNFHYARGGIWQRISLGSADNIHRLQNITISKETFLMGTLFIIAFFYLAIFYLMRELRYTLYFSLVCLFGLVTVDTVGQFIFINSSLNFNAVVCIWYSATTWLVFFLILFMHELYKSHFSTIITKIYLAVSLLYQTLFLFLPMKYYTRLADITNLTEIAALICIIIIIVIGAVKGHMDWILNLLSMVVLLICYVHDILYWTNKIQSKVGEIFFIGAFIGLFLQMVIQAKRIKEYFNNKATAELMLLQAQIKPHFLYNVINTVISISRYDAEKSRNLLIDFSQYLRRSFDFKNVDQMAFLRHEIELAKAYVAIEKARFGDRLEVIFDIDENLDTKVPILVLQPLIENAVVHGVLPKTEGGRIIVTIKRNGSYLAFSIEDNGIGMDLTAAKTDNSEDKSNIGILNIDSRLKRLYGRGLDIKSEIGRGTYVSWFINL